MKFHRSALRPASLAALIVAAAAATIASASATSADATTAAPSELGRARAATARYHQIDHAFADGYVVISPCVEVPGLGAMGVHVGHPARMDDPAVDVRQPEMLLYLPSQAGMELVGIEYWAADADQDLETDGDRPTLLGQAFDGPMPGHGPDEPVHYDLHVWLWEHNPAGLFAQFNPDRSCETGAEHAH